MVVHDGIHVRFAPEGIAVDGTVLFHDIAVLVWLAHMFKNAQHDTMPCRHLKQGRNDLNFTEDDIVQTLDDIRFLMQFFACLQIDAFHM